jgi:putative lipoic acid-binding regulatory protein
MRVGTACGALSPNESRDAGMMHREFAEEVVVVVKRMADEDMATYLRVKPSENARNAEMKGGT